MRNQPALTILSVVFLIAAAGCQQPSASAPAGDVLTTTAGLVSVSELAALVGMRVAESSVTHTTLRNSSHTVMLFTLGGGKVYLDAKPIAEVGQVKHRAGQVYVPRALVSEIRSALGTAPPRATKRPRPSGRCVVLDPGHGGKDPGAISTLGFYEKGVNLAVALRVAAILQRKGVKVVTTRSSDRFVELEERAAIGNRHNADLFVSIHCDSSPSSSTRGFTMYVARSAAWSSRRAAAAIARSLASTGLKGNGTRGADFRVLVHSRGPAVLIELGYISNTSEAALLKKSSFQDRLARAIAEGIIQFLG